MSHQRWTLTITFPNVTDISLCVFTRVTEILLGYLKLRKKLSTILSSLLELFKSFINFLSLLFNLQIYMRKAFFYGFLILSYSVQCKNKPIGNEMISE